MTHRFRLPGAAWTILLGAPFLLGAAGPVGTWPSGPGWSTQGDPNLSGLTTNPTLTPDQQQLLADALEYFAIQNPGGAATLQAGLANGAIQVVDIVNEPGQPADHGASDKGTMGLELDGKTPAEVAGVIAHEWAHVQGIGAGGGYPHEGGTYNGNDPCQHAGAYAQQINALCFNSCVAEWSEEPGVSCAEWRRVTRRYGEELRACRKKGGTPSLPGTVCDPPTDQPTCGCA